MHQERYIRQTTLAGFGKQGQEKLSRAKVLVIGAGGLGVPVLTYLNAMGVGTIGIVDEDVVSLSNLHRQVLYDENDLGTPKVHAALNKLKVQNSNTNLVAHPVFLTVANALSIIEGYDVVVDASDNFPTRYLVNDACVLLKKPFVYGALHAYEGQVSVFNYQKGPTYRCLFPTMPKEDEVPNCNENGVLGIIPGIIGNLQALEVIKLITGVGSALSGQLLLFNGLHNSYQKIKFKCKPENLAITKLQDVYEWHTPCAVVPTITVDAIPNLLQNNAQIIDVRTPAEYENYHLPNSLHIPLNTLAANTAEIDFSVPVYLLCQSGKRSAIALKQLQSIHPKTSFFSILGGINQYLTTCS